MLGACCAEIDCSMCFAADAAAVAFVGNAVQNPLS